MDRRNLVLLLVAAFTVAIVGVMLTSGPESGTGPSIPPRDQPVEPPPEPVPGESLPGDVSYHSIRGLVLDADTYRPLPAATVRFCAEEGPETESDDGGAWSMTVPFRPSDEPAVRVEARGYVPRTTWIRPFSYRTLHSPLVLTRLESVTTVVSGIVVDPTGRPVAGAKVYNERWQFVRTTDERGEFHDIPWGRRMEWLIVAADGWPLRCEKLRRRDDAGPHGRVRIVMAAAVAAAGLVVDDRGLPVAGALVHDDGDIVRRETHTDESGHFEWPVAHCGYDWVTVEKEGHVCTTKDGDALVHGGAEIRVVLKRTAVLAGRVLPPASGGLPAGLRISTGTDTSEVGEDGSFRLSACPPGEVVLSVHRPAPFRVVRHVPPKLRFPLEEKIVVLQPGEIREDVEIRLEEVQCLSGRVLDDVTGRSLAGASVGAVQADTEGRYEFTAPASAAPGDLALEVRADGYLPWRGTFAPEIRLTPWREVEVRAITADGRPVAGLGLWPEIRLMDAYEVATVTDASGRAVCRVAAPGPSIVSHADRRFPRSRLTIPAGVDRVDWKLFTRPVVVTIRVTDEAGQPLSGLTVKGDPDRQNVLSDGLLGIYRRGRRIRVTAPGREVRWIEPREWGDRDSHTVALRPSAPVRGRVLDADGRPVPDVTAYLGTGVRDDTDGQGRFRIEGVASGERVEVRVSPDGCPRISVPAEAGGPEVEVRLPSRGTIRIQLPWEHATGEARFYVFGGTLDNRDDWIEDRTDLAARFSRRDAEGLTFSVPAGTVSIWLRVPPGVSRHYLGLYVPPRQTVAVAYDFPALGRLSGTVTDPAGRPLEGADIVLENCSHCIDSTDEEGRFRMDPAGWEPDDEELSVGPWSLVIYHDDFAPHFVHGVDLTQDHDLSIQLREGGRLVGRLVPPVAGAGIEVVGPLEDHCHISNSDRNGAFRASGPFPPGPLRLRVAARGYPPVERTVEIPDGGEASVVIELD